MLRAGRRCMRRRRLCRRRRLRRRLLRPHARDAGSNSSMRAWHGSSRPLAHATESSARSTAFRRRCVPPTHTFAACADRPPALPAPPALQHDCVQPQPDRGGVPQLQHRAVRAHRRQGPPDRGCVGSSSGGWLVWEMGGAAGGRQPAEGVGSAPGQQRTAAVPALGAGSWAAAQHRRAAGDGGGSGGGEAAAAGDEHRTAASRAALTSSATLPARQPGMLAFCTSLLTPMPSLPCLALQAAPSAARATERPAARWP